MIAIKKSDKHIPDSLSNQKCVDSLKAVTDLSDPTHKGKIKQSIYGANDVVEKLKKLYNNKCAYCETYEPEPEIEHYRPKKQIKNIARSEHEGYYWLAYEWTNLLPACHDCNKIVAKGNNFPIEGERVYHPIFLIDKREVDTNANKLTSNYLQKEKSLLINPEIPDFNPFNFFEFNSVGRLKPKALKNTFEYRQADVTIQIIDLNRDKLFVNYRKKKIRKIFNEIIKQYYKEFLNNEIDLGYLKKQVFKILSNIYEHSKPYHEYSFFWNFLYKNFDNYIAYYLKGKHKTIFLKFYTEHKSNINTQ